MHINNLVVDNFNSIIFKFHIFKYIILPIIKSIIIFYSALYYSVDNAAVTRDFKRLVLVAQPLPSTTGAPVDVIISWNKTHILCFIPWY